MELGGAWNRGGTRSLFPYELLIRLGKLFHLAQDFYWYNPSRLPTPAEWVTIRRTRVKEAVTMIWWLSKSTEPQADNRRVLQPYSKSMKRLLKDGYQPGRCGPSQHRDRSALPARQRRGDSAQRADGAEHALLRRIPVPVPGGGFADPSGAISAGAARFLYSLPDAARASNGARSVRRQQHDRAGRGRAGTQMVQHRAQCGLCRGIEIAIFGGGRGGVKMPLAA